MRKYMEVQVTVIGSSPAWPNPGSAHAGYLVESSGRRLLLDCGPGVLSRLRTDGQLDVHAILISHFHLDHWGDLVPWVWMRKHLDGQHPRPTLWIPPGGSRDLGRFADIWGHAGMFEEAFEVGEYPVGQPFRVAGFEVTAFAVSHYDVDAFGVQVRDEGGRVLAYSGDTGPCAGLAALAAGADLFLCEATLGDDEEDAVPRGHLSAGEALAAARGRTVLTHRPAELAVPAEAERAVDGLVLEV